MAKSNEGGGSALYFVGFVGALIYFMKAATGLATFIAGFFKALVWPAYVVYQLLTMFYGVV